MSDKINAASERNIDSTNKTEAQPLIRKSTINDFGSAQYTVLLLQNHTTNQIGQKQTQSGLSDFHCQ